MARVTLTRSDDGLDVVIGPARTGRHWFAAMFFVVLAVVSIWPFRRSSAGLLETAANPASTMHRLYAVAFLLAFIVIVCAALLETLWDLFGREHIVASRHETTIRASLFFVTRSRSFPTARVTDVDWREARFKWFRGARRNLFFAVDGRSISTTSNLGFPDANYLAKEVRLAIQDLQRHAPHASYRG